jgi:eukaryotic-like serine/threonine-protein kinase
LLRWQAPPSGSGGEALTQKTLEQDSESKAVFARKDAEGILEYLLYQLRDKLQLIGHLDIIEGVQKREATYYKSLGFGQQDATALHNWAALLDQKGDRLMAQGDLNGAKTLYQSALEIAQELAKQDPTNSRWQHV